jgi:hypothetical protein
VNSALDQNAQGFVDLTLRDTRLSLFCSRLVVHRLPQWTREARGINGESDVLVLRSHIGRQHAPLARSPQSDLSGIDVISAAKITKRRARIVR